MGEGFDLVGKKNMMKENREKRRKYDEERNRSDGDEGISGDSHFI